MANMEMSGGNQLTPNEFWKGRRVFVTGATGIVGSWLVKELLQKGVYIVTLVRDWDPQSELTRSGDINGTNVVCGALEDFKTLERAINENEIDTVFHLGAQTIVGTAMRNPMATFEANIRGTYNLLEACRIHRGLIKQIVVASSDKAYGDTIRLPYSEEMPLNGRHPYDVSKSCADLIAMSYAYTYGLPVSVARCGNVYGGGDLNWSRIVPGTIRSALSNQNPILRSDGNNIRDYIFVLDVVEGYLTLAARIANENTWGEAFNFSTESRVTVLEITHKVLELMGRKDLKPVILNRAQGEIKDQYLDASKAKRLLKWFPRYGLERGLNETIHWYQEFFRGGIG